MNKNLDLLNKLRTEEQNFLSSVFIAPSRIGTKVHVSIKGILLKLSTNYDGWGIFRPLNYKSAEFVREPSRAEKRSYMNLLPAKRMVLINPTVGVDVDGSTHRIYLIEGCQRFDTVLVRTDGYTLWFDQIERNSDRGLADYLRGELPKRTPVDKLEYSGLSDIYKIVYSKVLATMVDPLEQSIKNQCIRSGASLKGYKELPGDTIRVDIEVDGEAFSPVVRKGNLQTISAGICLDGHDSDYDLQSLVHVLREGMERGLIYRW